MGLARLRQQGNELGRQRGRDGHGLLRRSRVRRGNGTRKKKPIDMGARGGSEGRARGLQLGPLARVRGSEGKLGLSQR